MLELEIIASGYIKSELQKHNIRNRALLLNTYMISILLCLNEFMKTLGTVYVLMKKENILTNL
jgi:hypothetical protein